MAAYGDQPGNETQGGAIAVIAPIIAFVLLPLGLWGWFGLGLDRLATEFVFFHSDAVNWVAGAGLAFVGVWILWLMLSKDIWPALCRFGNWLGRE